MVEKNEEVKQPEKSKVKAPPSFVVEKIDRNSKNKKNNEILDPQDNEKILPEEGKG